VLVALAVLAWTVSDLRMSGMASGPGSPLGTFGFFVVTWVVMMAAMMFPSAAPMVAMYVSIQRGRRRLDPRAATGATACFVAGYLLVWGAAGVLAFFGVKVGADLGGSSISWIARRALDRRHHPAGRRGVRGHAPQARLPDAVP
jgi:predicted metal-binding membrane protein